MILHMLLSKIVTDYFDCSEMTAKWIFPEEAIQSGKVEIIKIGVEPNNFFYEEERRSEINKKRAEDR